MTNYQEIYEIASNNYGLITNRQAAEVGVSRKELCAISKRGRIHRVARGVYRLVDYIPVDNDVYASSVLSVGEDAYLYGESVLAMHNLCPVETRKIYVGTKKRVRKNLPKNIQIINVKDDKDKTNYEGIPSQSILYAIVSCKNSIMADRLIDAAKEANRLGLLYGNEYDKVLEELGVNNDK